MKKAWFIIIGKCFWRSSADMIKLLTCLYTRKGSILTESPLNYPWECRDGGHKWGGAV